MKEKTKIIKAVLPPQYETYKASLGVASEAEMTEEQIKKIYVLAVEEFLKGDISTDGISAIFNRLFTRLTKLSGENFDLLNAIISQIRVIILHPQPRAA